MTSCYESILSSVNAGRAYQDSTIIASIKSSLAYLSKFHNLEVSIKQLDGHAKPTIILTLDDYSYNGCYLSFDARIQDCLKYFKYYDGIIREVDNAYYIVSGFCFSNIDNITIDMSSFDYTYKEYKVDNELDVYGSSGFTVDFIKCKNITITGLPKYRAKSVFSMMFDSSTIASIISLPKNTNLHIWEENAIGKGHRQFNREISIFKDMNLKSLELDANYFTKDVHDIDVPGIFRFSQSEVRDNINPYWYPELEAIWQYKIAKKVYIRNDNSLYLIKRKNKDNFESIKQKNT